MGSTPRKKSIVNSLDYSTKGLNRSLINSSLNEPSIKSLSKKLSLGESFYM
jgi:hypothetical protein